MKPYDVTLAATGKAEESKKGIPMNELTEKFIQFCNDKTSISFPITQEIGAITGKEPQIQKVCIKLPVSETLISILVVPQTQFKNILNPDGKLGHMSYVGFFSLATQKLYATPRIEFILECDRGSCCIQDRLQLLSYEPLPQTRMTNMVEKRIIEKLLEKIVIRPSELSNEKRLADLFPDFLKYGTREYHIFSPGCPYGGFGSYFRGKLETDDIEKYLDDVESWAEETSERLLTGDKKIVGSWISSIKQTKIDRQVLEKVSNNPTHVWNIMRKISDATFDAKTVTVYIEKNGISGAFHICKDMMFADKVNAVKGNLSSSAFTAKDRKEAQRLYMGDENKEFLFSVRDIKKIVYRKKIVFEQ